MWTMIALAAITLAPAQADELKLTNDRPTYGIMGAARTEDRILPGDVYWVTFDIENLKVDEAGKISYSMGMEMTNAQGKTEYKRDPQDIDFVNSLGGASVPAFAGVEVRSDAPAGEYTLKVTVTDRAAKRTQTLTRKFEVLPIGLGIVRLHVDYFTNTSVVIPAPATGVAGQTLLVNLTVVGFLPGEKKDPNVVGEMQVLDEQGKPTVAKPFAGESLIERGRGVDVVPMQFLLALNRPGKFTVRLKITDRNGKKTTEASLPINVVESK